MQYKVERQDKGKVQIKVELPATLFDDTYKQVVAEFKKDTKIPGFRPGMAPDDIVEGQVGSNKILNEAGSFLISNRLAEILKKEDLVPMDNPNIAIDSLSKGSPFSFTATFTLKPTIKVGDWKKIKITKIKAKDVTEDDVTNSIKNVYDAWKKSQAEKEKAEVAGSEPAEEKYILDAKGNKIVIADDEGKNKVEVNKIDDEFAKKIGARDLSHLKELVKKDLETIIGDQVETDFEQKLFDEMAKTAEIEVPEMLVDDELNRILLRLGNELERQNKTLEDFLTEEKMTLEDIKAKWRTQAEKNVKISLTMDEIGKQEKIQVTKEEMEAALAGVNQTSMSAQQKRDMENYLVMSIFQAKTLDLIKRTISEGGLEKPKTAKAA